MSQRHPKSVATDRLELPVAASITIVVVGLSFFLHWKWCGSDMQLSEAIFVTGHEFGLSTYPFSIRPFLAYLIELLTRLFSLEVKTSFFVIQFSLAAAIGLSFYYYLRQLSFSIGWSRLGLFLVLSAYPILAAHIEPMHTRDDLWAHLFVILALHSLLRAKLGTAIIWFILGCFAREETLVFYPIIIVAAGMFCGHLSRRRLVSVLVLPLLIYGSYYVFSWQDTIPSAFSMIQFNFDNPLRTSDTVFSVFMAFGFMWPAALISLRGGDRDRPNHFLNRGVLLTLPITILLILFCARARETRLFFPPFVFMIPLTVMTLQKVYYEIRPRMSTMYRAIIGLGAFALLMTGGIVLGEALFPEFEYRRCPNFQRLWAGIHFGLIFNLALFYTCRRIFVGPANRIEHTGQSTSR